MFNSEPSLDLEHLTNFERVVQTLLKMCLFGGRSSLTPQSNGKGWLV